MNIKVDAISLTLNALLIQRIVLYLTIISAFLSPFFLIELGPIHVFPFRIFLILLFGLFFFFILYVHNGHLNLLQIKIRLYLKFLAIWLGYAFISMLWSADQIAALKNIIFLFTGISIVFFLVYYMRDINHFNYIYWIWISIFIGLIPIGFWEITTGNHLVGSNLIAEENPLAIFAPTTVFGNQNGYATFIALSIPMIITAIRYYSKLYIRVLGVIVLLCGLFLLIMTTSRANYLAYFIGLSFWFIFLLKLNQQIKTLVIGASICILLILAVPEQIQYSLALVEGQVSSLSSDADFQKAIGESDETRINLIKNALFFTVQSVGFGVGAGNAEYYMEHYKIYPTGHIINVHNWWAEILVNYGVFIFAGYVILYVMLFLNLWRAYKKVINRTEKMICEALLFGLVSFVMASMSSSSIIASPEQWIFFGFALAFLNYTRIKALERRNLLCTF